MRPCLVFDLDDTLYAEHQYVLSGFKAVDQYLANYHKTVGFLEAANKVFMKGERGNIFDQTLQFLGVPYTNKFILELVDIYREHKPEIRLFNDARWALDYFSARVKTGLITDGYLNVQRKKIESLGIAKQLESIIISDSFGREFWKPHEKPYLALQADLQVAPEECIYVGDNVAKDFITAKRLGWQTICIKRRSGEYKALQASEAHSADINITSLRQLPNVLS